MLAKIKEYMSVFLWLKEKKKGVNCDNDRKK